METNLCKGEQLVYAVTRSLFCNFFVVGLLRCVEKKSYFNPKCMANEWLCEIADWADLCCI